MTQQPAVAHLANPIPMGLDLDEESNIMYPKFRMTLVLALGVLFSVAPFVFAAGGIAEPSPRAIVVWPEDPPTTYYIRDMGGQMLTVDVPSLGSPEVRISNPRQGTVEAVVMAVDVWRNQVTVQTQAGQTLMLNLSPGAITGMQVGDQFTLVVAPRLWQ